MFKLTKSRASTQSDQFPADIHIGAEAIPTHWNRKRPDRPLPVPTIIRGVRKGWSVTGIVVLVDFPNEQRWLCAGWFTWPHTTFLL
jgi:hypothetical protein